MRRKTRSRLFEIVIATMLTLVSLGQGLPSVKAASLVAASPRLETLDFIVNTNADTDDGACDVLGTGAGNQDCTLREAINAANENSGLDTITFDPVLFSVYPNNIIALDASLPAINDDVTIDANGTDPQNTVLISGADLYQVLTINSGKTLNLQNNLGIANGVGAGCGAESNAGGGICNDGGTLNAYSVGFYTNYADGPGGGLYNNAGIVSISYSVFQGNVADYDNVDFGSGGGIHNHTGTVDVSYSSFDGNSGSEGGALKNELGTMQLTNSIVADNSATASLGGGIQNSGTMTIANSTIYSNTAGNGGLGGGINNYGGTLTVLNSTVSHNSAGAPENPTNGAGGGIDNGGTLELSNSIIANNGVTGDCLTDSGTTTGSNNLIEDAGGLGIVCGFTDGVDGNIIGVDPKLGAPAYNGGATKNMALLNGSPAIDAGDDAVCAAAPVNGLDQRDVIRPQGLHCDIGAFEAEMTPTAYVVNTTADTDDGACDELDTGTGNQDCTLREAINAANVNLAPDTITFSFSDLITLVAPLPAIDDDVTIDGADNNTMKISGDDLYQILVVNSGKTLNLKNIQILHGLGGSLCYWDPCGGALANNGGTVNVQDVLFALNHAAAVGGAIFNSNGSTMTMLRGGFQHNSVEGYGGAIINLGTLTMDQGYFYGNSATNTGNGYGGAIAELRPVDHDQQLHDE